MSWNYRIVKRMTAAEETYAIHEAFYEEGEERPHSITEDPVHVLGETVGELEADFAMMMEAFALPVLNYEDF